MTDKFYSLTISNINYALSDTLLLTFDISLVLRSSFAFKAGQYLNVKAIVNQKEVVRSYSLFNASYENEWSIAIKKVEKGLFSNFAFNTLKIGDTLQVSKPQGAFCLEKESVSNQHFVFYAAGSGITPIFSLIKSILIQNNNNKITLFYVNKTPTSRLFFNDLDQLQKEYAQNFSIINIYTQSNQENELLNGRIDKVKTTALFNAYLKNKSLDQFFICGPHQMLLDITEALKDIGITESKIHYELFFLAEEEQKVSNFKNEKKLIFKLDGLKKEMNLNTSLNLLEAIENQGFDPPFACRQGICCSCRALLISGEVTMNRNYGLSEEDVQNGFILTCQAIPKTDSIEISFDD